MNNHALLSQGTVRAGGGGGDLSVEGEVVCQGVNRDVAGCCARSLDASGENATVR